MTWLEPDLEQFPSLTWDGIAPHASTEIRRLLERALERRDGACLSENDCHALANSQGADLLALLVAADALRRELVGNIVSYVVNRNINFTNVCFVGCKFCAFSRGPREADSYFLSLEEVGRKTKEAWALGATEVCIQGGLPHGLPLFYYRDILRAVKSAVPGMHIHAFSPMEIVYGVELTGMPLRDYLAMLRDEGLGTLPGTAAEILDDDVRQILSRNKLSTAQWQEVIRTAHASDIPTTSTLMYGHRETPGHWVRQLLLLRQIQSETGGFTEFVPLSLIHQEAPMYRRGLVPGVRQGATGLEVVKMHALARLFLGPLFRNIQSSWVKEGPKLAQLLLASGANDVGGTLINESISTSAGASYGQLVPPVELRRLIRDAGRIPAQRSTTYDLLRLYEVEDGADDSPLDHVENAEARFGSYRMLASSGKFRFLHPTRVQDG